KVRPIKVPLLLDVVGKQHLKQGVHYKFFSRLYRVTWEQADRFVLQESDTLDAPEPIFGTGLEPYVTLERLGSERTFTDFSAQATCEISAKGEVRVVDMKALPQSSWSKTIVYSPHLLFDTERGLHNTETTVSSLDALKVAPAGIRFLPVEWLTVATTLSYRVVSYALVVLGFGVLIVAAGICRRADKRVEAALPGIAPRRSFRFAIVPGGLIAMLGWTLVNMYLRT